jgi:CheY-like chemotaxis protein
MQSKLMIPIAMCIDDDPIVLMLNDLILKEQFFCDQLIKLDKAELALDYFKQQAGLPASDWSLPNIIFLDINMPVMDGWEFLEIFTKDFTQFHENIKVVILSSSVNPADLELAKNHPLVINFIPKPIGETELENLKKHESLAAFF